MGLLGWVRQENITMLMYDKAFEVSVQTAEVTIL